jgi:hypothetical protein
LEQYVETIADILWDGQPLLQHIIIPIGDTPSEDWMKHPGYVLDQTDDHGAPIRCGYIMDDELKAVVAAVFASGVWTPQTAVQWLRQRIELPDGTPDDSALELPTAAGAPIAAGVVRVAAFAQKGAQPKGASVHYFRKLLELLKERVGDDAYKEAQQQARSYAGGKLRGQNNEPDGEADLIELLEGAEPEPEPSAANTARSSQNARRLSMAVATEPDDERPYLATMTHDGREIEVVWKRVSRVGTVFQPFTGEPATITREILQQLVDSFQQVYQYVDIPIGHEWDAPHMNTGFVRALELRRGGLDLWAAMEFTEPDIKDKVLRGTIADVSVWIDFDVFSQEDGTTLYPSVLAHVCLTNKPLMTRLGEFSMGGRKAVAYAPQGMIEGQPAHSEAFMPEFDVGALVVVAEAHDLAATNVAYTVAEVLDGVFYAIQDATGVYKWFAEQELLPAEGNINQPSEEAPIAAGLTDAQLQTILRKKFGLDLGAIQQQQRQMSTLAARNRQQTIQSIAWAMEGRIDDTRVVQVHGTRHYPAVIEALQKQMTDMPAKLKMSVDVTGDCPELDDALLAVVNALPKEARQPFAAQALDRRAPIRTGSTYNTQQTGSTSQATGAGNQTGSGANKADKVQQFNTALKTRKAEVPD